MKRSSVAAAWLGLTVAIGAMSTLVAGQVDRPLRSAAFEANRGQAAKEFDYIAKGFGYAVGLTSTHAQITASARRGEIPESVSVNLVHSQASSHGMPVDRLKATSSYFSGNISIADIPTFAKVKYDRVWPGVDVVYYGTQQQLEQDFIVAPQANPKIIRMRFDGAQSLRSSPDGDLILVTQTGQFVETKPTAYQLDGTRHIPVLASYTIHDDRTVSIRLGRYDRTRELVIDPITRFLYPPKSGNSLEGHFALDAAAVVTYGNTSYLVGWTAPLLPCGSCITPYSSAFVSQIDAAGDLIRSSEIGATDGNVFGTGAAVDANGLVYLTGYTDSVAGLNLANAFQSTSGGGQDAFLARFGANLQAPTFSTYLGGSGNDQATAVAVSGSIAYVVGATVSTDFPVAGPPATENGFVFALDTSKSGSSAKVYGLLVGGSGNSDAALSAATDSNSNLYVGGETNSLSTSFLPTIGGTSYVNSKTTSNVDGFLLKLNTSGTLVWGTFLPAGVITAVAVSGSQATVAGQTSGSIQTTSGAYQLSGGSGHGFVATLDTTQSGVNSLLYSTYLGGSGQELANAVAVGKDKKLYVAGATTSSDFPTAGTPPPLQATYAGGSIGEDGFFSILNPAVSGTAALVYSTFVGSAGNIVVSGLALDGYNQATLSTTSYTSTGPQFGSAAKFGTTFSPLPASVTGDINGDGDQDVIVYNPLSGGFEYSLLSQGNGAYTGVGTFMGDINPNGVTFDTVLQADFNGDLKSDVLFYSSATGTLKIGLANLVAGAGTPGTGLYTYTLNTIQAGYTTIARGDFNNDGKTDLLLYRSSDGSAAIALSNGDGTFNYVGQTFSPGFTSVVVGDFNGDGISDVVVYNNSTPPYNAYLLFGDGTGHLVNGIGLFLGGGFTLFPSDLNSDGKTDLVMYRPSDGTVFIGLSNGSGFAFHYQLFSPGFTAFKIGDVTGDGNPDFILYNSSNGIGYLLIGDGTGNFPSSNSLFFGPGMDYVELRDVNGDGKQDVLLYRTSDGTNFTGISNLSTYGFAYTYNYFGPSRIVAK